MWGTLFSISKDDSLDKKQIQIIVVIVVIVVKLIFYYQNTDMSVFFLHFKNLCIFASDKKIAQVLQVLLR